MLFLTDVVLGVSVVVGVSRRCEQPVSAHCFSDRNVKLTRRDFSRTTFLEISVLKLSNHCFFIFSSAFTRTLPPGTYGLVTRVLPRSPT